jgi:hypothetical protein
MKYVKVNIELLSNFDKSPIEFLNYVVDKYVGMNFYERESLPKYAFLLLMKYFKESKYSGIGFRSLSISQPDFNKFFDSIYDKVPATDKLIDKMRNTSDIPADMFDQDFDQYYDGGNLNLLNTSKLKSAKKQFKNWIFNKSKGKYVSWCPNLKAAEEFNKLVSVANRSTPIQFQDYPESIHLCLRQRINGVNFYELIDKIEDSEKIDELLKTKEIIAPIETSFEIVYDKDEFPSITFNSRIDPNE